MSGYVSEVITDRALAWLRERDASRPFCLLVHHKAPHANWEVGPGERDMFEGATFPAPPSLHEDLGGRVPAAGAHRLFVGAQQWELHYRERCGPIPGDWRASFYYRYYEEAYGMAQIEGVRTGTHKLIRYGGPGGGVELYDLRADPREMGNLAGDTGSGEILARLEGELGRLRGSLGAPGF